MSEHAKIKLGEYEVPLIGVPADAALETCDNCGLTFSIQDVKWTEAGQLFCNKHFPKT